MQVVQVHRVSVNVTAELPLGVVSNATTTITGTNDPEDTVVAFVGDAFWNSLACLPKRDDRVELLHFLVDRVWHLGPNTDENETAWTVINEMFLFMTTDGESEGPDVGDILLALLNAGKRLRNRWEEWLEARVYGNGTTRTPEEADGAGETGG